MVICCGSDPAAPGAMSFTMTVPLREPSVFHSSVPCVPSLAEKKKVLPSKPSGWGLKPAAPGLISLNMKVPLGVPLLTQSSEPADGEYASKYTTLSPCQSHVPPPLIKMLVTLCVPAGEPFVTHSWPDWPLSSRKYISEPTAAKELGSTFQFAFGRVWISRIVPAWVPSVLQSSVWSDAVCATQYTYLPATPFEPGATYGLG